jgi:hypothetical protein
MLDLAAVFGVCIGGGLYHCGQFLLAHFTHSDSLIHAHTIATTNKPVKYFIGVILQINGTGLACENQ